MSRASTPTPIEVPPTNNVYTALALAGVVGVTMGLIVLFLRAKTLGVDLLKF